MILREGMFSVLPIPLELTGPGIFVLKKGEKKKESHANVLYLPVSLHSFRSLDVYCKFFVECGWY